MNWNNEAKEGQTLDETTVAVGQSALASNALFLGDRGQLSLASRKVLVQLLQGPSIDANRQSELWAALVRDTDAIRRYLSDLFLELVIDQETQVAFTRQAEVGEIEAPKLLRRTPLTFIESVLLLELRQRLMKSQAMGSRAVISLEEIQSQLVVYEKTANTDTSGFAKRVMTALERVKKYNVLTKIRGSEDRYEISPILKLLLSADEVQALSLVYQEIAAGKEAIVIDQPEDVEN